MSRVHSMFCSALLFAAIVPVRAQESGAHRLHALVNGLTVTPRVLIIGARPGDADADLIASLARGHHVQTGFLSLTRGESAPNYGGLESGATLGAIHVQEMLAARRIDGGEQYFTRAYDFGSARNVNEVFRQWDHATLLGDVVAIVRAFRPHVIVATSRSETLDRDGQRQASAVIAREVFDASLDTARYPSTKFGLPWSPSSLYEPGLGVSIDSREYDPVLGRTFADIAVESRSQLRSFGFETPPWQPPRNTQWHRIATRAADAATADGASSLFAGIDTSFVRLQRDVPHEQSRGPQGQPAQRPMITQLPDLLAYADSARRSLDLAHPEAVLPYLKRVSELASVARRGLVGCRHPSRDAVMSIRGYRLCEPEWLDLDASLDLVQRRSSQALLTAAGITFESVADREFLASGDTALVAITVVNNSDAAVLLNDVSVSGSVSVRMTEPVVIPAHGSTRVYRSVINIAYAHPWWIFKRKENFYPPANTVLDGVPRPGMLLKDFSISGIAVPEDMRRLSDVTATLTIGMTTVSASVGEVVFRTADAMLGMRERALSGTPSVTLGFDRPLEWAQAGKPLKKEVRVTLKSFSDKPLRFALKHAPPIGVVRIESLPPSVTLAPREAREVSIQLRAGAPPAERYDLGLFGVASRDTFEVGFRTAQYSWLSPLHLFRGSTVSVQVVDIEIPNRLSVAYVRGAGDDADVGLKGLGVPVYVVNNEGLTRIDLEGISTVVIGPEAFRVDRGLVTQIPRLTEFARKGGTVVVLSNPEAIAQNGILPFPVSYDRPFAEQVTSEVAPVVAIDSRARLLSWPNVIRGDDWLGWVGARALAVPTTVDSRYALAVETHDPEQKENRNSILVAMVGKGRIIYTSLTLTQQISNAVPGAMRIFVNLLSAGLPIETKIANTGSK